MTNFNELQEETREIITDLLNDGSDPDALYIIEHHIAHYDFDALENFPKDFSTEYFETFIKEKINIQEFRKWVECFKNQYRNLGCEIE